MYSQDFYFYYTIIQNIYIFYLLFEDVEDFDCFGVIVEVIMDLFFIFYEWACWEYLWEFVMNMG